MRVALEDSPDLEDLLAKAEGGERIVITRGGREVAQLDVAERPGDARPAKDRTEDVDKILEEVRRIRKGFRLGDADIRELLGRGE